MARQSPAKAANATAHGRAERACRASKPAPGLALANRSGRLNLVAGALILGGAALFADALYAHALAMLALVVGSALILGWGVLAFAIPAQS